jgi:hypothetical protein
MGEWVYRSMFSSWRWVVSFTLRPFYLRGKSPIYVLDGGCGPRSSFEDLAKRKPLILSRLELRLLGRPVRNQSLYRLRYLGSLDTGMWYLNNLQPILWPFWEIVLWKFNEMSKKNSSQSPLHTQSGKIPIYGSKQQQQINTLWSHFAHVEETVTREDKLQTMHLGISTVNDWNPCS